jgi:hypothetical protein
MNVKFYRLRSETWVRIAEGSDHWMIVMITELIMRKKCEGLFSFVKKLGMEGLVRSVGLAEVAKTSV